MLEVLARTPLRTWTDEFGLTAAQIVALPAGDWAPVLLAGWSRAAIAQRDHDWMAALISRALTGRCPGHGRGDRGAAAAGPAGRSRRWARRVRCPSLTLDAPPGRQGAPAVLRSATTC